MRQAFADRFNRRINDQGSFNAENANTNKAVEVFVDKRGMPTEFNRPVWRSRIGYSQQHKLIRGRKPMTQKQVIMGQDSFDKKMDQLQANKLLLSKPTELRRPIYRRKPAAGRPFESNEAIEARDIKTYGIKVNVGDALTKSALNRDMPDPNDASWLAEYNRRLALGESHEEIMKALPLGRPQHVIPFAVNLERITRETAQVTVDAINEMSARNLSAIGDNPKTILDAIRRLIPWLETMPRPKVDGLAEALIEVYPMGARTSWSDFGFPYQYLEYNNVIKWKDLVRMWTLLIATGIGADIMNPFRIIYGKRWVDAHGTYAINRFEGIQKIRVITSTDPVSLTEALRVLKWRSDGNFMTHANVLDLETLEVMPLAFAIQRNWERNMRSGVPFNQVYGGLNAFKILEHIEANPDTSAWNALASDIKPVVFIEPEFESEEKKE